MVADLYPAEAAEDMPGGRVPPQDIVAEQSVLGAMMLSKQAIDPASELLSGRDFYRPAHEAIFEMIVDLANRGEPVDALTVKNELQRRGELARVGGAPYLHTLVETVPNVASADYYASIVHEKAVLRRLIEVGNRISSLGWAETGELESLVDTAQQEVMDVDSSRGVDDYRDLASRLGATIDESENRRAVFRLVAVSVGAIAGEKQRS